jgi:hypothetical protein
VPRATLDTLYVFLSLERRRVLHIHVTAPLCPRRRDRSVRTRTSHVSSTWSDCGSRSRSRIHRARSLSKVAQYPPRRRTPEPATRNHGSVSASFDRVTSIGIEGIDAYLHESRHWLEPHIA